MWPTEPLPWQGEAWQRLQSLVVTGQVPPALLVTGAPGIGKLHLVRSLAGLLLCRAPAEGKVCGNCQACELMVAGNHGDLLQVSPADDSRVVKIDQVRDLINFAHRTPGLGERKVIVLSPAEAMNINAANALLKCLEEPAASTHLLLVSHRPSALTATIRSRCQALPLPAPSQQQSLNWLTELTGEAVLSEQLLNCAPRAPLAALALAAEDQLASRQALLAGLDSVVAGQLSAVEFPALVGDLELEVVLEVIAAFLRQQLVEDSRQGRGGLQSRFELLDRLQRLCASIGRGANPNRQLTIEDTVSRVRGVLCVA